MKWSEDIINSVWEKARKVNEFDPTLFRIDACGAWIMRDKYGKDHPFGWVIDHIYPVSKGGTDELYNLRPLQIENNMSKSDDFPSYISVVTAEGVENIHKEVSFTVNEEVRQILARHNLK